MRDFSSVTCLARIKYMREAYGRRCGHTRTRRCIMGQTSDDETPELVDLIALHDGRVMTVHDRSQCAAEICCIHNPSDHHMVTWPQFWRSDKLIMERWCQHHVGHPDPDDINVQRYAVLRIHTCDGCCMATPIPLGNTATLDET